MAISVARHTDGPAVMTSAYPERTAMATTAACRPRTPTIKSMSDGRSCEDGDVAAGDRDDVIGAGGLQELRASHRAGRCGRR